MDIEVVKVQTPATTAKKLAIAGAKYVAAAALTGAVTFAGNALVEWLNSAAMANYGGPAAAAIIGAILLRLPWKLKK